MSALAAGEGSAFDLIYRRHARRVLGYLRPRLSDREEAEDLTQQVFSRIWESAHLYRSDSPFLAWVFAITRNVWRDHLRRFYRNEEIKKLAETEFALQSTETEAEIGALLSGISEEERQLLTEKYIEGLSFADLELRHQTTAATLRKRMSRLLKKLRPEKA